MMMEVNREFLKLCLNVDFSITVENMLGSLLCDISFYVEFSESTKIKEFSWLVVLTLLSYGH